MKNNDIIDDINSLSQEQVIKINEYFNSDKITKYQDGSCSYGYTDKNGFNYGFIQDKERYELILKTLKEKMDSYETKIN